MGLESAANAAKEKSTARKHNFARSQKITMRRFPHANILAQTVRIFRSFLTTSIDRGIGIDRIGIDKSTFESEGEINGAQAKFCSVRDNRDASISLRKHRANACIFSIVFDNLDRSRHRNRSNRSAKIDVVRKGEINGAPTKLCSGTEKSRCVNFLMKT